MYKILVLRRVGGHPEGHVAEVDSIDDFWEHQMLAGNAVVLSDKQDPDAAREARENLFSEPSRKLLGKRGKRPDEVDEPEHQDPED